MELTVAQARQHAADFMYIWADEDKFLRYIPNKYAAKIRAKKANQNKLIALSAQKYGKPVSEYTQNIRAAFIEAWKHTPAEALVILAQGGQIAGKNWQEGVFGVGALPVDFSDYEVNGQKVTVNAETGHILLGGTDITDESKTVYNSIGKKTIAYQLFSKDVNGVIFMSQYNRTQKKYYAESWSDDHATYSAKNGQEVSAADSADIWGNIMLSLEKFINWLISLFGGSDRETINAENTLPNQQADGFVYKENTLESGGILLALAAGGALLASGGFKKKKSK